MPHRSKIRPSGLKKKTGAIKVTPPKQTGQISFNFSRLNEGPAGEFKYSDRGAKYLESLLGRLKIVSTFSSKVELLKQHSGQRDSLKLHPIKWKDSGCSKESFGLPNAVGPDADDEAFQISLGLTRGRIHGYFVSDIFHIVWLDPRHNLYPGCEDVDITDIEPESESDMSESDLNDCRIKLAKATQNYDEVCKEFCDHLEICEKATPARKSTDNVVTHP